MVGAFAIGDGAEHVAHAVFHDHGAHDARCLLDVLRRTRRDFLQHNFLSHTAAHRDFDAVHEFGACRVVAVFFRQHQRVAARAAARNDRDLVHGVGVLEHHADERMAAFVIGRQALFFVAHDMALALWARDDALDGFFELLHLDLVLVTARREQRGLIDEVREVGTREARRTAREDVEIDIGADRLALCMDFEDGEASAHVRLVDDNLAVETARTQQRRVEDVGAVRRRNDDDAFVCREAIHLDEQLVQRLLALVVAAAEARTALAADGVNLVDEDDAGRVLLRLLEQVAHARGADTDEHLDEVGTRNREERHARLARDSFGEQRLARARRAEQQHAFRDARAELVVLLRMLEEFDDFLQLLLRLVGPSDILEVDLHLVAAAHARPALAEVHDAAAAALRLLHHVEPDAAEQEDWQERREHLRPPWGFWWVLRRDVDVLRCELVIEAGVAVRRIRRDRRVLRAVR